MSRVAERFAALRARGEKALIPYITAGDPSLDMTRLLVRAIERAGADMLELGLAFSDPLADGPVIQAGSQRALAAGANTEHVLALVAQLREDGIRIPLLIMTYYNLLHRLGVRHFCARAQKAGVDALIIPDLPLEEADEAIAAAQEHQLDLIQFVAPTSGPERIRRAADRAGGFLYAVSLTGVTGQREQMPATLAEMISRIRSCTAMPVAVGFGISNAEQVRQVAALADGVIVGSAFVRLCGEGLPGEELVARIGALVSELKAATKGS